MVLRIVELEVAITDAAADDEQTTIFCRSVARYRCTGSECGRAVISREAGRPTLVDGAALAMCCGG